MVLRLSLALVLSLTAACNDSGSGTPDTTDTTDTTANDTTTSDTQTTNATETTVATDTDTGEVAAGTSPLTGVNTNVTVTEPTPNAACATADHPSAATGGAEYPWGGLTVGTTAYTCNGCPDGLPELQGSWRLHGFQDPPNDETPDYNYPDPATKGAFELLVDGNTFMVRDSDPSAGTDVVSRGWYFCSQKPENDHKYLYWVDLGKSGADAITRTDTVLTDGTNNLLLFFFANAVSGTESLPYPLCRLGTTRNGQTCDDPFAP